MKYRKVVLAYHSVDGETPAVAGSHPISMERFRHQMDELRNRGWEPGWLSQIHCDIEKDTFYVTGDDGTVDWTNNVLPYCELEGIPTHTALIAGVWNSPIIYPVAHRLQVLLSLPDISLPEPRMDVTQRMHVDQVYGYETDSKRRYLKGACNILYDLPDVLDLIGAYPGKEEEEMLKKRFSMPYDYVGFTYAEFGSHTVLHWAYGGNTDKYMREEVDACRDAIMNVNAPLVSSKIFVLPMRPRYGHSERELIEPLYKAGYRGMLDGPGEWDQKSFIIPRIDAKKVEQFFGLPEVKE